MDSFNTPISSNSGKKIPDHVENNPSKKRKLIDNFSEQEDGLKKSKPAPSCSSSLLDSIKLQLETPLPLDRQRCLDIQSEKVHFCNTRTETRMTRDPGEGRSPDQLPRSRQAHMRLELELNLPCDDSSDPKTDQLRNDLNSKGDNHKGIYDLLLNFGINHDEKKKKISAPTQMMMSSTSAPSWLAFEGDEKSEMVATVCKRCFMLVMLCKASPACPNCKFMYSPDQIAPSLFKRGLIQLLY